MWTRTDHFPALRCGNCGFVFMNSQLDEAGLNDYYNNYLGKRRINNSEKMEQRAIQYQQDAQVLFDRGVVGGKLLDVGCNGGFFLSALGQRFERFGTEIDPEAIDFCRANFPDFSANVFSGVLESAKFDSSYFDVVTMRGVVEHIPSPFRHAIGSGPDSKARWCPLYLRNTKCGFCCSGTLSRELVPVSSSPALVALFSKNAEQVAV